MSFQVRASDLGNIRFAESETVSSVLQNIAVILSTPRGSVPLYREFGLDMSFLDKPIPVARTMMISRVREAIERWEPRAKVVNVTFSGSVSAPAQLDPVVEVEINDE